MSALTPHQQQAFRAACQLIDRQRASDIRRLKHWQHGMCGCLNAVKPNMPDVAAQENDAIQAFWDTLPGSSCWLTVLYMLCSHQ